jgi:hypothetical protein
MVYNVSHFIKTPITWKIAIDIFILILPICLFLQVYMNISAVKDERYAKISEFVIDGK